MIYAGGCTAADALCSYSTSAEWKDMQIPQLMFNYVE
jgi:hypothetical protein